MNNTYMIIGAVFAVGVIAALVAFSPSSLPINSSASRNIGQENRPKTGEIFFSAEDVRVDDVIITITSSGDFDPANITVHRGTRVVWVNESGRFAWPASNIHPTHEIYPAFDPLEPMAGGEAWSFVFDKVGEWQFHDHLRPGKVGTVTVVE